MRFLLKIIQVEYQLQIFAVGGTIITNETVGIVTVTLATPILGFSTAPFEAGD